MKNASGGGAASLPTGGCSSQYSVTGENPGIFTCTVPVLDCFVFATAVRFTSKCRASGGRGFVKGLGSNSDGSGANFALSPTRYSLLFIVSFPLVVYLRKPVVTRPPACLRSAFESCIVARSRDKFASGQRDQYRVIQTTNAKCGVRVSFELILDREKITIHSKTD